MTPMGDVVFDEDDIDLLRLSSRQFEEACFDLLLSLGYQGLCWRQGGADAGRDIEGRHTLGNALVGTYEEKWFFECKRYEEGVPPAELNSKIAWADAERPNHLAILTTSHLTNGSHTWLEKIKPQKPYAIHVVDGKALRRLFSVYPDIVSRHFIDGLRKLLLDARRTWLVHNIIPEAETLRAFAQGLQLEKLSPEELAFLWSSAKLRCDDVVRLIEDSEPFYFDPVFDSLADAANTERPVVSADDDFDVVHVEVGSCDWEQMHPRHTVAELVLGATSHPRLALYSFVTSTEGDGLEVLVEATGDYTTRIRYIESGALAVEKEVMQLLMRRPTRRSRVDESEDV